MKTNIKKQAAVGIAGFLISGLGAVACVLWGKELDSWLKSALLGVCAVCLLGFLFYISGGRQGFKKGALFALGLVLFGLAAKGLPAWMFAILVVVAAFIFIVTPQIKQYRTDREKSSETVIDKKLAAEIRREEAEACEELAVADELKASIGFGEASLLLESDEGMYQLIKGADKLFFKWIGEEAGGMDTKFLITDFSDETAFLKGKKDFCIAPGGIKAIKCGYGALAGLEKNCGTFDIATYRGKYTFLILDSLPKERLEAFFEGLPFSVKEKRPAAPAPRLTSKEKAVLPGLKKACLALTIASVITAALFFFYIPDLATYRALSAVCMLIPAFTFALYIKYNKLLSIEDKKGPIFKKASVNVSLPRLVPSAMLAIRTLYDFNVTGWVRLIIWSAAIVAAALLAFFKFTKEYKRKKAVLSIIILSVLFYAPSAVMQVNCLYDNSAPIVYSSALLDKHMSKGNRGGTYYYFNIEMKDGEQRHIKVGRDLYETYDEGSLVTVVEQEGLLGVSYAYIGAYER
jgi:hypothetical protein